MNLRVRVCAWSVLVLAALVGGGCRRAPPIDGTPLYAPFNPRKPVAVAAARLEGGRYEVAVRNLLQGRTAIRLDQVSMPGGGPAVDSRRYECVLGGGERARLAAGVAEVADSTAATDLEAVGVAVPLDDPGRSIYREWQRQRRPGDLDEIDAELARLDALPLCEPQEHR